MKTVQKITSFFLALTFLISSLGFTANKMVCVKSGKTKLSLVNIKDCCPEKGAGQSVGTDCCDITNTFFDLGDIQNSQNTEIAQPVILSSFFTPFSPAFNSHSVSNKLIISFADLPPPRSGRALLSFISTLII
jgi:hypothetical protein